MTDDPKPSESDDLPLSTSSHTGFDAPVTLRGSTTHFNVYYQSYMSDSTGTALADAILQNCEHDYTVLSNYFGGIGPGSPFNIIILPLLGGGMHHSCEALDIYCHVKTQPVLDVNFTRMLMIAEISEVFMAVQGRGWNCESSSGEGLSQALAASFYGEYEDFLFAATWLDTPDRPDFVNINDPTDRNPISIGCSRLFLNYLHYQLHYEWDKIIQAVAPTLGQTYTLLTGASDGLDQFKALLQAHFPPGSPSNLKTDNPFPL